MRILFLFLLSVFLQVTAYSQSSERPEGIVLPVATLGDVTETRRQILQNTLIESLSSYYRLVPQDKLEEVQEKIFQEMDYDECTEDQCIVMIQEALQVENLFVLQVIGEGDDTQLSLKWVGLDDKKVKTDYCEDCGTKELNDRVEGLVRNLDSVIPRGGNFVAETVDEERLKREREEELKKQREEDLKKQREEELRKQREEELRKQREEDSLYLQTEIISNLNDKRKNLFNIHLGSGIQTYDYTNSSNSNYESIKWVYLGIYFLKLKYKIYDNYPLTLRHELRFSDGSIVSTSFNQGIIESNEYKISNISDLNFETSVDYNFYFNSLSFWLGFGIGFNNTDYVQSSLNITHKMIHQTYFISLTTGIDYNFENFGLSMYGSEYSFPIMQNHEYKINNKKVESEISKTGHLNFGISFFY